MFTVFGKDNSASDNDSHKETHLTRRKAVVYVLGALSAALLFALAFSSSVPEVAMAGDQGNERLISVTGQAEMRVKPDMADINFGVETNGSSAQEAQSANSAAMTKVIKVLEANGIAKEDIQTSNFSLYPVYDSQKDQNGTKQVLVGYRCNNTVTVRVKDLSKIGSIIDLAVTNGATNVGGITFGLIDPKNLQSQVLAQAVKDARTKAEIMASAAGVSITGIQKIYDGNVSVNQNTVYARAGVMMDATSTPIEAGNVVISASVRVDYTF